jgi:hypothetical protein
MTKRSVLALFIAALAIAPLAGARGSKQPSTAPGKYKDWGPDIDQIEIVKAFKIAGYDHVVIQPFDTSKAPLPDPKEKWYTTLKAALSGYTQSFYEAFQKELKSKAEVQIADTAPKTPGTLIIRGSVEDLDPGSRAGRYFVGYGTGGASTKATIEIVDANSGEVLARVTQARRSGGTWKVGGGSDLDVMRDSVHALGKDIAHVLDAFQ